MKPLRINHRSIFHRGEQPIRVLQFNITKQFESTNPTFIELAKQTILIKGLQAGISYHINNDPICLHSGDTQTPFVDDKGIIHLHETFLSYIWCITYSMIVLYDEAVAKPIQNNIAETIINEIDKDKIENAKRLFDYAISLINNFTKWDTKLPNPEEYSLDDTLYIEKANGVFIFAINFILCHEFAHVELEHIRKLQGGQNTSSHYLSFEKEADNRAIELMLQGITSETKRSIHFGILIGLCSLLFFKKDTSGAPTHPDTDDRINNILEKINPESADGMWGLAALAFKLWDNQFAIGYVWPKEANDMKDLYKLIKSQINNSKKP